MWRHDMFGRGLWSWLGRPALSWQLFSFLLLFPVLAIVLIYGLIRLVVWVAGPGRKPALRGAGSGDADENRKNDAELVDNPKRAFELVKNGVLIKTLEGLLTLGHGSDEKKAAETVESLRLKEAWEKVES